ncbi:Maternal effect embryo arrest protein [Arachis hypogaea]|nr:Maternal effect embryo arrest protein [Arachis hypogaea]
MALSADHLFEPVSATACSHYEAWKKKCSKLQESQNALRQVVKLLETKINEVQAQNVKLNQEEQARGKADAEEKLKECNVRVSLENEVCSLRSEIDAIRQKPGGDAKNGNESIEGFQACIADKEKEISRLKELLDAEKKMADKEKKNSEKERKKAAEAFKAVEAKKSKTVEKEMQIAKVEAEKAEEYKTRLVQLEKEAKEAKTKLSHKCERLGL